MPKTAVRTFKKYTGPIFLALALLNSFDVPAQTVQQHLNIDDMHRVADLSNPVTSPDGQWIAYTVTQANLQINKAVSHIWLIRWDGTARKELVVPEGSSAWQPQFTADSRSIVFIADRGESHTSQLWVQDLQSEAARQLTTLDGGINEYSLAPDNHHVAVISEVSNGENENDPIVIDRYQFKDDERGYLTKKRRRLFSVSMDDQHSTALTPDDIDVWLPAWSPDGNSIAYVGKRQFESDRHAGFNVYLIDAATGKNSHCISRDGNINNDPDHFSKLAWSPDSQLIAYLQGGQEHWLEYAPWELAIVNVKSGEIKKTGKLDRNYINPKFSADGKTLYAIVEESRTAYLTRIDVSSGRYQPMTKGQRMDVDYSVDARNRIVLLACEDSHPCRLSTLISSVETTLPDHNDWLNSVALARSEDIEFKSRDGSIVHALLMKPLNYQPNHRYPTIVRVHGGPVYQFSHEFMFDWQIFAAQGYAVLAVNPRGSSGRGFDYARAIWADWGHKDVEDVLAATDYVVAGGIADKDHLGIGGWSYGGMLTDYTIARDTRFKAAIAGAGAANILSNYGSEEYVVWLESELGTPWKNLDAYLKVSYPFYHNDRIVTPTLFMCASLDFNVPCIGSEQMYQALNSRRVPTQLVVYKDQHHGLDVPSYLSDRLTRYVNWYDKYLK